jgi:hypothetical protein
MSEVVVLVEGPTEQKFVQALLVPNLAARGIYLTPIILSKPGEKGGDVKFARAKNDIQKHLTQRSDTFLTLMVDYYGIGTDWPGYADSKRKLLHNEKALAMNQATAQAVQIMLPEHRTETRFIPYVSMHETEALYFSAPNVLAARLGLEPAVIQEVLDECGEPEKVNDSAHTAPSKRLEAWSTRFKKTSTGIAIAQAIGLTKMREGCPIFNAWISQLEDL